MEIKITKVDNGFILRRCIVGEILGLNEVRVCQDEEEVYIYLCEWLKTDRTSLCRRLQYGKE